MASLEELILYGRQTGCSDIHLTSGQPTVFRRLGQLVAGQTVDDSLEQDARILSLLTPEQKKLLEAGEDLDFSFQTVNGERQRINVYRESGRLCAAIRLLSSHIPTLEELGLPPILKNLAMEPRGLVLVTGPTGSGKSTTLAAMIDAVNESRSCHILTIEDPIEYIYTQKRAMIHQREVGADVRSFSGALRSALREDPDVILVGEMRDFETISAAVTAAETGHLVLSTLHTPSAAQSIDRIVDVFPTHSQGQIRIQLASVLKGVLTQQLIPRADGTGRIAATEILLGTDAVLNLIREGKGHQIPSVMQSSAASGMHTLDADLARLVREQLITPDAAMERSANPTELRQYLPTLGY